MTPGARQRPGAPVEQRSSLAQRVIATAGHVDHGKSSLVKALTGTDPDRLREEQERQMTIDLGFAFLPLPSGLIAAIVDVPGHRDFIHNMLAGVGGIDAVLLVIAADEGIMPQTREHLSIVDLLGVSHGVAAITKADLVDEEWLALVTEEVGEALAPTTLAGAPILPTSAVTGKGLPQLVEAMDAMLASVPPALDMGRPRLPIDRVFSLRGHGTIVTGTLLDGCLAVGDQVTLQPSGSSARIRSLQTHGEAIERALPGTRTAANLAGLDREQVRRGEVLAKDDWLRPTTLLDVWLRYLEDAPRLLEHGAVLRLFSGTADTSVRVRLLESDALAPGESQYAQLVCDQPIAVARRDRFILREESPSVTVGGGVIIDAHPSRRHKRLSASVREWLTALRDLPDSEQTLFRLSHGGPVSLANVAAWLDLPVARVDSVLAAAVKAGLVDMLSEGLPESTLVVDAGMFTQLTANAVAAARRYQTAQPLQRGMPREELRRVLRLRQAPFAACVARWLDMGLLASEGDRLRTPDWQLALAGADKARAEALLDRLTEAGTAGLTLAESSSVAGDAVLQAVLTLGDAIRLPDDIVMSKHVYDEAVAAIVARMREAGGLTVAQVRDLLGSNRRSTLALLGHMDDEGITRREGDLRLPGRRFPGT